MQSALTDEILTFARQLGVSGMQVNTPALPGAHRWEHKDARALRTRCEEYGLASSARGISMPRVMRALQRVGFTGFLLDDHVPFIVNDTDYGHRGRAHAIGDMQGLLDTLAREAT